MSLSYTQKTPMDSINKSHTEVVEGVNNEFVQRVIPRTLGFSSVNYIIDHLSTSFGSFDTVTSTLTSNGDIETLVFKNGATVKGTIYLSWDHLNWTISTAAINNYLLLETGDFFLLEDGTSKILLE